MRAYGKIETGIWQSPKFRAVSERGQRLFFYVVACPHGNAVGCFVLPVGYATADLGWDSKTVSETIGETVSKGLIERDDQTGLTWIRGWWGHNTIENPNVAKSAARCVMMLPHKSPVYAAFIADLDAHKEQFKPSVWEAFRNGLPNPIETKEPEPKPEPEIGGGIARQPVCEPGDESPRETTVTHPDAVRIIHALDAEIVSRFGDALARPWPNALDLTTAQRWLDAGATLDLAQTVIQSGIAWLKAHGRQPPTSLKYFERSMADAIAAAAEPMPKGNAHARVQRPGAIDPEQRERERRGAIVDALRGELEMGGEAEQPASARDTSTFVGSDYTSSGYQSAIDGEAIRGVDGEAAEVLSDVRPSSIGPESVGGVLPGESFGPSSRSVGPSDRSNNQGPQVPDASSPGGHTSAGERRDDQTQSATRSTQNGPALGDDADSQLIAECPAFLRKSQPPRSHHEQG